MNAVALFDIPSAGNGTLFTEQVSMQGGQRAGVALDGTKQFGSKNLVGFGGKYDFLRPIYSQPSATNAFFGFGGFTNNQEIFDFLPNDASCPNGPGGCGYLLGNNPTGARYCTPVQLGNALSLSTGLNTGPALPTACQLPYSDESTNTNRQDFAFYVKDTFSPTDRLKFDIGLRMDGVNWKRPACDINCVPAHLVDHERRRHVVSVQLCEGHAHAARVATACRGVVAGDQERLVPVQLRALGTVRPDRIDRRFRVAHGLQPVSEHAGVR